MKVEVCPLCLCYLNYESAGSGQKEGEWWCDCGYTKQDFVVTKSIYKGLE